jgi:hypothetical protein
MEDGGVVEVAMVGREGFVGMSAAFGAPVATGDAIVQLAAEPAAVMSYDAFCRELDRRGAFYDRVTRYSQAFVSMLMQSVACNGLHSAEERCSRWLLMTHDRIGQDEFALTHELLAIMLCAAADVTLVIADLTRARSSRTSAGACGSLTARASSRPRAVLPQYARGVRPARHVVGAPWCCSLPIVSWRHCRRPNTAGSASLRTLKLSAESALPHCGKHRALPGTGSARSELDGRWEHHRGGCIGREGLVGLSAPAGEFPERNGFVQVADGTVQYMPLSLFVQEMGRSVPLREAVDGFCHTFLETMIQAVACNRLHTFQERCARWLLLAHDRLGRARFELRVRFLARAMGARNSQVAAVLMNLEQLGVLRYDESSVTIVDAIGLRRLASGATTCSSAIMLWQCPVAPTHHAPATDSRARILSMKPSHGACTLCGSSARVPHKNGHDCIASLDEEIGVLIRRTHALRNTAPAPRQPRADVPRHPQAFLPVFLTRRAYRSRDTRDAGRHSDTADVIAHVRIRIRRRLACVLLFSWRDGVPPRLSKGCAMAAENLHDLFVEELRDIYDAEKQLTKRCRRWPRPPRARICAPRSRNTSRITHAGEPARRSVQVGWMAARGKTCEGMKGLIQEVQKNPGARAGAHLDAALIASAQSGALRDRDLRTLATFAEIMDHQDAGICSARRWTRRRKPTRS